MQRRRLGGTTREDERLERIEFVLGIVDGLLELRDPLARLAQLRGYLEQGGVPLD